MTRRTWIHASLFGLTLLAFTIPADAKLVRDGGAKVTFHATGPAGMAIEGKTDRLELEEKEGTVVIKVPLATLSTGIGLRDEHMRDKYLEVQKYPDAVLRISRSALEIPQQGGTTRGEATGKLTLHGQTRDVPFRYAAAGSPRKMNVNGKFRILMTDFGIKTPSYMGVKVKPEVDIDAKFSAKDR